MSSYQRIAEEAWSLARSLPLSVVEAVATRLEGDKGLEAHSLIGRIAQAVASPHHRSLVVAFLDRWRGDAGDIPPQAIVAALHTAVLSERERREGQSVELVWTGPESGTSPFRRTEQAILQVLDSATHRILLVSYAVYKVPRIAEALARAASRGVRITILVESPDRLEGQNTYSTLKALGNGVAACATVYLWPREKRIQAEDGRIGILHVKCAVADGWMIFLSSANLTEYAFSLNMELGLLVTGGETPSRVEAHFDCLIEEGVLTVVSSGS
jgi:phosphatidylserine/phosphatidylglycerophosphate/cardiolipin synthase-like enzyme